MNQGEIESIIVDATMMRIAETILEMAHRIECGRIPDTGTVQTLRNLSKSIVEATTDADSHDDER